MPKLSVIIITKNEALHIHDCLASVTFADEIIVVDAHSADNTVTLCHSFTNKVFVTEDWPGFGPQKNRALDYAQGEWILSLDADERVSPTLQQEIQQAIQTDLYTAFSIPRRSSYCGRWMQCGYPDRVIRLFKKDCARLSSHILHEKVEVFQGCVGTLKTPLLHYSFSSLEEVLEKVNSYSSIGAHMLAVQGKKSGLRKALLHGLWTFFRTYFLKRGFLDGREGFMLAVSNAEGVYYRYLKLMYLGKHAHQSRHHHL